MLSGGFLLIDKYPSKRVKDSSACTGRVTLLPGSTLPPLLTCPVTRILIIIIFYFNILKTTEHRTQKTKANIFCDVQDPGGGDNPDFK